MAYINGKKVLTIVAGGSKASNPYEASTTTEMTTYLSAEYLGSVVKYTGSTDLYKQAGYYQVVQVSENEYTFNELLTPNGTLEITVNGDYDVTEYVGVKTNIQTGITPTGTLEINTNNATDYNTTVDVTNYANVIVKGSPSESINLNFDESNNVMAFNVKPYFMREVSIIKPSTLLPTNIKKGVTIAGITGTFEETKPTLNAPTITINDTVLTITNPSSNGSFVTSYDIYSNGTLIKNTTSKTLDLSTLLTDAGTYSITVKAKGTNFNDSAISNSASYVIVSGYEVSITLSGAGSWGNGCNVTYTDTSGTYTKDIDYDTTLNGVTYFKLNNTWYAGYDGSLTCLQYSESQLQAGVTLTKNISIDLFSSCFVEGTLITMADGSTKAVENIKNGDQVLCWNFDDGKMESGTVFWVTEAKEAPCYWEINLDDGTNLKLVGAKNKSHRLFSVDNQRFMYPQDFNGKVYKQNGDQPKILNVEKINKTVKYFNFANTNLNSFANGIMTGCRFSNVYQIKDMKFIKDNRELLPIEEFNGIPSKYIDGLRLREQRLNNDAESVNYYNTIKEHVLHNYVEQEKGYSGIKNYKQWEFKKRKVVE